MKDRKKLMWLIQNLWATDYGKDVELKSFSTRSKIVIWDIEQSQIGRQGLVVMKIKPKQDQMPMIVLYLRMCLCKIV